MQTCFVILGSPRTGTNAVGGFIHRLGVPMGRRIEGDRFDFNEPNEWNPSGFAQDAEIENLQQELWGDEFPAGPQPLPESARTRLRAIIEHRSSQRGDWGVKTSRMANMLADFRELCPDEIKLIYCTRDADAPAKSWKARSGYSLKASRQIIDNSAAAIATALSGQKYLTVRYDDLASSLDDIAAYVGRPVTSEAKAWIDMTLRRF